MGLYFNHPTKQISPSHHLIASHHKTSAAKERQSLILFCSGTHRHARPRLAGLEGGGERDRGDYSQGGPLLGVLASVDRRGAEVRVGRGAAC